MSEFELSDYDGGNGAARGREAISQAKTKLKQSASAMHERVDDVTETARAYADKALGQLSAFSRSAVEAAKERPATSALTILGVGVLVGAALALVLQRPARNFTESALDEASRLRRKLHL
ncbi:hypothetical protein BH11PSE2_BH11PSE2_07040 [soil metagenome]